MNAMTTCEELDLSKNPDCNLAFAQKQQGHASAGRHGPVRAGLVAISTGWR